MRPVQCARTVLVDPLIEPLQTGSMLAEFVIHVRHGVRSVSAAWFCLEGSLRERGGRRPFGPLLRVEGADRVEPPVVAVCRLQLLDE